MSSGQAATSLAALGIPAFGSTPLQPGELFPAFVKRNIHIPVSDAATLATRFAPEQDLPGDISRGADPPEPPSRIWIEVIPGASPHQAPRVRRHIVREKRGGPLATGEVDAVDPEFDAVVVSAQRISL